MAAIILTTNTKEEIARLTISEGWNVRQLESAIRDLRAGIPISASESGKNSSDTETPIDTYEDPDAKAIAERISRNLGVDVKLKVTSKGGILTLTCKSCEALERLTSKLIDLGA